LFGGAGWGPSFLQSSDFRSLLFFWFVIYSLLDGNKVIRKARKTQHQKNPEFDHTQGEIRKKPAKKYISIQRGMKLRKPSILVVN